MPRLRAAVHARAFLRRLLRPDGPGRRWRPVRLEPEPGTERLSATAFAAAAGAPWLALDLGRPVPAGCWIRLRYGAGLLGDPVRPVLRMADAAGEVVEAVLPGPACGWAVWTGRLPEGCVRLSISPAAGPGPVAFAVEGFMVLSRPRLLLGALASEPGPALGALRERLLRRKRRARHRLAAIWSATPLADYEAWRRDREAGPRLSEPWAPAEPLRATILVDAAGATAAALAATLDSLAGQEGAPLDALVTGRGGEAQALPAEGWVGARRAGDRLLPGAAAAFGAAIARRPDADLLFCDQERVDGAGGRAEPVLKPGWSPRLQEAAGYLGGFVLTRAEGLALPPGPGPDLAGALAAAALRRGPPRVAHVRRVLLRRAPSSRPAEGRAPRPEPVPAGGRWPSVAAIVPTRDRLGLLRRCVEGALDGTDYPALTLVLVDNGSERADTRAFYASLAHEPRVSVIERPGPFNFSALTNAGAAASASDLLLLLNNDVEMVRPDWLKRLVVEAAPDDVGAVGAKLLYANGRVQHEGVAIGLGGVAGHLWRGRADARPGDPGWRDSPREVSAVTGACLLVPRAKYDAVGGLDEERFPVSLNDIDLCLKLRREGWRVILAPDSVLLHHESASRGRDDRGAKQERAEKEAALFAAAWPEAIRDDPYFHPALSLLRFEPSLG